MTHSTPRGRVFALDNLRAALVMLVILHQAALVYSAFAPFYYVEPPFADPLALLVLGLFALVNQSWFMAALFFIAGYFTPDSYDHKGPGRYLGGRLLRLGLPLLVGFFILEPVARLGLFLMPSASTGITAPPSLEAYPKMIGFGPLWFVALLLVFSFFYALWRQIVGGHALPSYRHEPSRLQGIVFVLGLALVAWLWRMLVPLGLEVSLWGDALSFPTLAYLPHYLALFVIGIMTRRNGWLPAPTPNAARFWFLASVLATLVLLPWALSGSFFQLTFSQGAEFTGSGTWQSGLYALWDSTMAFGLLVAALGLFEARINREGPVWKFFARQSYAAFLIHAVVVVFVAYGLHALAWPALAKFALLAAIVVPLSFGIAWVIRRIPGVGKVV
ncbi:MAG: acyltransferase family protein [Alphaproteobacteria bacterium]|nr:acyltransferase family protein [Alphaproteobacteria bacterium]